MKRECFRWLLLGAMAAAVPVHAEDVVVSAAISLSNAFKDIAAMFEKEHPGTRVVLNFGASDVLLKQIEQGAPADVFASADEATMDRAASANLVDVASRKNFASNTLVLIVGAGVNSPKTLRDLGNPVYAHIAIGNPDSVPAGRYAKQALTNAGLWSSLLPQLVQTQNVRQALDYVVRGEAQAGLVYATDAATQVEKVHIALVVPTATPVNYPIAVATAAPHPVLAREFTMLVTSPASEIMLKHYGFSIAR
jgi:molybdate transport system substrate-binding protein